MGNRSTRAEFSERVYQVANDARIPITELAIRSGIPYRTLRNRLEGNAGRFSIDELDAIAEATGTDLTYLLSGIHAEAVA